MIAIRPGNERGHFDHGWLDTFHTFSFGDYYDPNHVQFRALRVINEDRVAPGQGFGMHGHRDMEIVTYVLEGALAHQDSLGNGSTLSPGELQRMTAGSGIRHSEFNPSATEASPPVSDLAAARASGPDAIVRAKAVRARGPPPRVATGGLAGRGRRFAAHQPGRAHLSGRAQPRPDAVARHRARPSRLAASAPRRRVVGRPPSASRRRRRHQRRAAVSS